MVQEFFGLTVRGLVFQIGSRTALAGSAAYIRAATLGKWLYAVLIQATETVPKWAPSLPSAMSIRKTSPGSNVKRVRSEFR